jgi:hypothetical protein
MYLTSQNRVYRTGELTREECCVRLCCASPDACMQHAKWTCAPARWTPSTGVPAQATPTPLTLERTPWQGCPSERVTETIRARIVLEDIARRVGDEGGAERGEVERAVGDRGGEVARDVTARDDHQR